MFSHLDSEKESRILGLVPLERQTSQRIHLQIPIFVRAMDASGAEFLVLTKTLVISAAAVHLASPRLLQNSQRFRLTIPAPSLPTSTLPTETLPIQASVRHRRTSGGVRLLGMEFLKALDLSVADI